MRLGRVEHRLSVVVVAFTALVAAACGSSGGGASGSAGGNTTAPAPATPSPFPTAANASNPCDDASVPQTIDSSRYGPGDVIAAREIPVTNLTGAKAWRVLYVSIGVDEQTLLPVCGVVVAPDSAAKIAVADGTGSMLAWSHGTVGLDEQCQPSADPAKGIFGPQSGGIGAVSFGSQTAGNLQQGTAQNGVLQTVINRGWPVAATDYYAGGLWPSSKNTMPYVIASMSGAQVLDSTRAAAQVLATEYGSALPAKSYNVVTWGHSQGGHAAFWAAQLGRSYLAKTTPKQYTPPLKVVGTAVLAPATSFVASPGDPQSTWGTHLGDREMHQIIRRSLVRSSSTRRSGWR